MWTRFLFGFLVIIFAWSCISAGAYRLVDSLDEPYESCPAVKINAPHKTFYNVQEKQLENVENKNCGKRNKQLQLLLRIINLSSMQREPLIHQPQVEPKGNPNLEHPQRKLILILQKRPESDNHPHYM